MSETKHRIPGNQGFEIVIAEGRGWFPYDTSWVVQLPHQCDEWIAALGDSPQAALAQMDAFIAEAQAARAKLAELGA